VKLNKAMEPGTLITIFGYIIIGLGTVVGGITVWYGNRINTEFRNDLSSEELKNEFKAILTDKENKELVGFEGVQILQDQIFNNNRGYIKIKIQKNYLNSKFSTPVTLKNSNRGFQPITVICDSDPDRGPGFFVVLPDKEARTVFYFSDFLKFENLGELIYIEDFVFEIFFNKSSFYFLTISGAIKLEQTHPHGTRFLNPFRIGTNLFARPFDNKSYEAAYNMFPDLASFFGKDYSETFPDLYKGPKKKGL
jgi:hypothetical protein